MAIPLLPPKTQWVDSNGDPLVGGSLEFLDPATDLQKDTYPTYDDAEAQTNANTNPVVLDSLGQAEVWLRDNEAYKIICLDAADVEQWTVDDVTAPAGGDAANVSVADVGGYYTATDVEAALQELGDTSGAGIIGIADGAGNFAATDVEAALAEIVTDLASTSTNEGAALVGVEDAGGYYTGTTVEAVLQEIGGFPVSKRSGGTPRNSTTTFASDPDLAGWSLGAGSYELNALLVWYQNGGDVKIQWSFTGSVTAAFFQIQSVDLTGTVAHKSITDASGTPFGTYAITTMTDTETFTMNIKGIVNVASQGTLDLQWAQNTSDVDNTTLQIGSFAMLTPVEAT